MSIKSDRWIRRMAAQGMIEPFSPSQMRIADGHKIISYGTSSYGYDVRCADEFKIFTNINSSIVDPKNFDEKSFVDFKGPVCIIPPNSFALASTVEFFRIPRSVLTVCLGKCVTGDTRLVEADTGAYVPITEMGWGKSTLAWDGARLRPSKVSAFIPQGLKQVFELRTSAGLRIKATANHPFLTRKSWVPLAELKVGDRIAAARDIPVFGKTPLADAAAAHFGRQISAAADAEKFVPQTIFTAPAPCVRRFLQALFSGGDTARFSVNDMAIEYASGSRRLIEDVHHLLLRFGVCALIRETTMAAGSVLCTLRIEDPDQVLRFAERISFAPGSEQQRLLEAALQALSVAAPSTAAVPMMAGDRGPHCRGAVGGSLAVAPIWDQVASIEPVGVEEVYDITVPTLHNFVANGFIVHNSTYARCGIIVNVTPLEPEWEGHVTLEFSNTTPLPAKIYANEGVAQMLFLESDEVCETSYKDRGGKYQGQRGVTLPKA